MNTTIRSTFVTVVAWIFIALSGVGTLISVMQNVMIHLVFTGPDFDRALQTPAPPGMPPFALFMMSHMKLFFGAFLIVTTLMLGSSIGLLLRRNWARLLFVGLLLLAIVWNLVSLGLQFSMFSSMRSLSTTRGGPDMAPFFVVVALMSVIFALGLSALFGWIAKRLLSPAVAAEFKRLS